MYFLIVALLCASSLFSFDRSLFLHLIENPLPWMKEQLEEDFLPFEQGISSESFHDILRNAHQDYHVVRIKIANHRLLPISQEVAPHLRNTRLAAVLSALRLIETMIPLPDTDLLLTLHDGLEGSYPYPLATFSRKKGSKGSLLVPDFEALEGYKSLTQDILKASLRTPWEAKRDCAFWRGTTTGCLGTFLTLNTSPSFPRLNAVSLSLEHPDLLNARFTSVCQNSNPDFPKELQAKGMLSSFISPKAHLKYKYLLDIDGNYSTYSRFYWILLSNSACFKQTSPYEQWYYKGLKPYVHFIPLAQDISDFPLQMQWARAHDIEAKKIAENATQFAKTSLSHEATCAYFYLFLKTHGKLQQGLR